MAPEPGADPALPADSGLCYDRGVELSALGRIEAAEEAYRRAVALRPDHAASFNNLGTILFGRSRMAEAAAAFAKATEGDPGLPEPWYNLGNALRELGRREEAAEAFGRAVRLRPDYAEALGNLGNVLLELGRPVDAVTVYRFAIARHPGFARAHSNLGIALFRLGYPDEAIAAYRQAIALAPDLAEAHANLGNGLMDLGRVDEAISACAAALALRPEAPEALAALVHLKRHACLWSECEAERRRLLEACRRLPGRVAPLVLLSLDTTPAEQKDCAVAWARRFEASAGAVFAHPPVPAGPPGRRLRIGYLSADFHQHATATLTAELFELHDRARFEVVGYSLGPDDSSAMRARLTAAFDGFVDLRPLGDAAAARRINDDGIDILVDLKGYTQNARTAILGFRPAPIQVNYLGYPGTMGASFIDYIIVDPVVVPMARQDDYTERLVHLPECYQCNDSRRPVGARAPTRAECGLPEDGWVFCCFNNSFKITPAVFDVWMRLLAARPGGVLWLLAANGSVRDNLRREAALRGVDPGRLVFAPRLPLVEHLARYRVADLFLDTLPYTAHTTASDALWAGLPVLTCAGDTFAGRVAASLLGAVGLPDLVAGSLAEYEATALRLTGTPRDLAALRDQLARQRPFAPLFDTRRFLGFLEAAFARMHELRRLGLPPQAISVCKD